MLKLRRELGQQEEVIAFQKTQLLDADRGAKELEARILRLRTEHNEEVNAIEQKLQRERIDAQIAKNRSVNELNSMRKEASEARYKLR